MTRSTLLGRRAAATPAEREAGAALVLVIGAMLVLSMLALTALAYTVQSQGFARRSQDYMSAMSAAQSGIEEYVSRMNRADTYDLTMDCANLALQAPSGATGLYPPGTCGYTSTTPFGWLPVVANTTDPEAPHFHYEIVSRNASQQTMTLRSTGRVNGEYRTVEAVLAKGGSTDYVYYTDYESADPANVQAYTPSVVAGMTATERGECGMSTEDKRRYWYAGRQNCIEPRFISSDSLDGPVFSNDAVYSTGASFLDGFSSANPSCGTVTAASSTWRNCLRSGSTANFNNQQPTLEDPLYLDDTSAAFAAFPGCHYYGSTRVIFQADGKMRVWNKRLNNGDTPPLVIPTAGQPTPNCGGLAELDSDAGALVDVPNDMVIYAAPSPAASWKQCARHQLGGPTDARRLPVGNLSLTAPNAASGVSYTFTADVNMAETSKQCQQGNIYAEGVLNGRVTLASAQSIVVTGDLVLAGQRVSTSDDLLGLVATNAVEVINPRLATFSSVRRYPNCQTAEPVPTAPQTWQYCPTGTTTTEVSGWPYRHVDPTTSTFFPARGVQIAGSIQTLQHSFYVQRYKDTANMLGNEQDLFVYGSIAQRWRGIVGQTESNYSGSVTAMRGYAKDYRYDRRLVLASPPYFPRWVNAQWLLRYSGEIDTPPAVRAP